MRSPRALLATTALVLLASCASQPAAAGDIIYPSLTAQTTVQDTDLLATWRASGPLSKLNASVFAAYVQTKISTSFLLKSNNLSDVASISVARTNLGLGTAATYNIGTSGGNIGVLNVANTWGGAQTFSAGLSSTTGVFSGAITASGGLVGNVTGSASSLSSAYTIGASGDVACTPTVFSGTANITLPCTIQANAVTNAKAAQMAAGTIKGNASGSTANPSDLTAAQVRAIILNVGQVDWLTTTTVPTGWLECNGAAVSRATYAALFAKIGTTFGSGDGSTTFNLPDLRGEFIRGYDDGRGVDSGRTFGTTQADAMQGHLHGPPAGTSYFSTDTTGTGRTANAGGNASFQGFANTGSPVTDGTNGTPRTATETRPTNVALMAIIYWGG